MVAKATPLKVLERMKELLADETHWTKGTYAKDERDEKIHFLSEDATCFCLDGARFRAFGELTGIMVPFKFARFFFQEHEECLAETEKLLKKGIYQIERRFPSDIPGWNDYCDTTYDKVMFVLNYAIEEAKSSAKAR